MKNDGQSALSSKAGSAEIPSIKNDATMTKAAKDLE